MESAPEPGSSPEEVPVPSDPPAEAASPAASPTASGAEGERRSIARRAGVVALGTLSSRILGAARDMVIAATFPIAATDAFFVAFTIPNALRVLLGEGAVGSAFIPVFSEVRAGAGEEAGRRFYARLTGSMLLILGAVTVLGIVFTPQIVTLYAAGYRDDPELFADTVTLTRWVFPYIFFMGLAALGMGALNALRRFAVPAFAPALLNVALIAAPFVLVAPALGLGLPAVGALALGALIGGVLQVVAQWPELRKVGLLNRPRWGFSDPNVKKALILLGPLLIGLGIYQVNVMLGRLLASFLPEGSQSYLYYGQRLVEIPQGMLALAIASATLPVLADLRNQGEDKEVRKVFSYAVRLTLFLAIPSSVALFVLAEPIVAVLFGHGSFSYPRVLETSRSLVWQAAGVWAIASVRTVVPMFYAYNDTRTPVLASGVNLIAFSGTALLLMGPMQHAGIAVALSVAGVAQLAALLLLLRRKAGPLGLREVFASALKMSVASAAMGGAAWAVARLGVWSRGGGDLLNIAVLGGAVLAGGLAYFVVAKVLRIQELDEVVASLLRRVRRR